MGQRSGGGTKLKLDVASVSRPKSFLVPSRWLDPRRPGDHRHALEPKFLSRMGQARPGAGLS